MGTIKPEKLRDLSPELTGKLQKVIKEQSVKMSCASCGNPLGTFSFGHWMANKSQVCKKSDCEDKSNQIDTSKIESIMSEIGRM